LSNRTTAILFVIGFILLLVLLVLFNQSGAGFVDSMVPELIGFCLEGIFFIGLFSMYQHRRELNRKRQLSRSLRGFLGVFLNEMNTGIHCQSFKPIENPEELNYSHQGIERLANNINNCSINANTIKSLHKLSNDEMGALENLLPVAAELSADHMIIWHQILENVKNLGKLECLRIPMQLLFVYWIQLRCSTSYLFKPFLLLLAFFRDAVVVLQKQP